MQGRSRGAVATISIDCVRGWRGAEDSQAWVSLVLNGGVVRPGQLRNEGLQIRYHWLVRRVCCPRQCVHLTPAR